MAGSGSPFKREETSGAQQEREEPGAQDVFSPTISSTAARKKEEFAAVEWKRKSCVTAGKTWLIILILTVLSSARQRFIPFLFPAFSFFARARRRKGRGRKRKMETAGYGPKDTNRLSPLLSSSLPSFLPSVVPRARYNEGEKRRRKRQGEGERK